MARPVLLAAGLVSLMILSAACNRRGPEVRISVGKDKSEMPQPTAHFKPGPVHYVALGDSTGVGVGARDGGYAGRLFKHISERRPGSRMTNLCVSGATTVAVLESQLDQALTTNADLVTVGIGINDIGHGLTAEEFGKNYEVILSRLKSETGATILVTNIPDISTAPRIPDLARRRYHQLILDFNQRLEEIALRHSVPVFDIYTITHQELPKHPEYLSSDGFHPSDKGYELWAEQMWPELATLFDANGQSNDAP